MIQEIAKTDYQSVIDKINTYRLSVYQTQIKESSAKQYIQNWNRLYVQLKGTWDSMPENWFEQTDTVLELLSNIRDKRYPEKVVSLATQRNYLSALIQFGVVENANPAHVKVYTDARADINNTLSGTHHNDESSKLVTRDEVNEKVFEVLEKGGFIWSCGMPVIQYYMLMKLHTEHNLRNDCASLHFITQQNYRGIGVDKRTEKNWLIGKSKGRGQYSWTIELNDYKTKKDTDGPVQFELSKSLNKIMNTYLTKHWKKHYAPGVGSQGDATKDNMMLNPVFVKGLNEKNEMESINSNDMTVLLQKYNQIYLGKKIGTKMLRHSFYTEKYGEIAKDLKDDAKSSLHSVGTAINHYTHSVKDDDEVTEA